MPGKLHRKHAVENPKVNVGGASIRYYSRD